MDQHSYSRGSPSDVWIGFNGDTGFVQEYKAERALASLMSLSVPQAVVLRDGKQTIVPSQELVPGDVVVSRSLSFFSATN